MALRRVYRPCGCWATEEVETGIVLECLMCPTCNEEARLLIERLTLGAKPESESGQLRLF
jgi:hypothetical protein